MITYRSNAREAMLEGVNIMAICIDDIIYLWGGRNVHLYNE